MGDDRQKPSSAAWTSTSGAPVPETQPRDTNEGGVEPPSGTTSPAGNPETDRRGTDQESIAPGRSKPASEPAEDAPPNATPGEPPQ